MRTYLQQISKWNIGVKFFVFLIIIFSVLGMNSNAATIDFGPNGCTLQDAIRSANNDSAVGNCSAGSGADVLISPDVWMVTVNSRLPTITSDMSITTATNSGMLTISGDNDHAVMKITGTNTDVTLQRVFITEASSFSIKGAAIHIEDASVNLIDTVFTLNRTTARYGGAIYIEGGELSIERSYLGFNSIFNTEAAIAEGGAIFAEDTDVEISESTFTFNKAKSDLRRIEGVLDYYRIGWGPSIFMDGGTLNVEKSTFNEDISSIHGEATVATIVNSTFNRKTPLGWEDLGGLLDFRETSALTLNHVTIKGGLRVQDSILNMTNSILRGECNLGSSTSWIIDSGNIYNTQAHLCPGTGNIFQDPRLLDLANNGGLTATIGMHRMSDAINSGDPAYCTETDQRGEIRDDFCDIGAFEVVEFADIAVSENVLDTEPYVHQQDVSYQAIITNNSSSPVNEVRIDLSLDNAVLTDIDSGLCESFPCVLNGIQGFQQIIIPMTINLSSFENDFSINLSANRTINSTYEDTNEDNNTSTINFNVIDGADLAVDLDLITRGDHFIGQVIEYAAVIDNLGFDSSSDVEFEFMEVGMSLISMTGCNSVIGSTCQLGLMNNGSRKDVEILASVTEPEFDAVGTVLSSVHDINLANNIDQLGNNGALGETDVTVEISPITSGPYYSYGYVQFQVKVSTGNESASNLKLWATFPESEFIGCSGSMNLEGYCELGSLAANSVLFATLDYFNPITSGDEQELFPISVSVNPGEVDLDVSNNTASINVAVDPNSDLAVQLELATEPPYYNNQELIYNLRVVNGGLNHASNVGVELLFDNLSLEWEAGVLCQSTPCQINQLNRFDEENMTLAYRIIDAGDFSLSAAVSGDQVDLNLNNNVNVIDGVAEMTDIDIIFKDSFEELTSN